MIRVLFIAFVIAAICVVIHITGLVLLAEWIIERRGRLEKEPSLIRITSILILVFAVVILLHLSETAIWAAFYQWWNLFPDYETSLYFSVTSYTTMGFGDVVLPQKWRILGGIEGFSGVLLCGVSTAFIFIIVNALLQIRVNQQTDEG